MREKVHVADREWSEAREERRGKRGKEGDGMGGERERGGLERREKKGWREGEVEQVSIEEQRQVYTHTCTCEEMSVSVCFLNVSFASVLYTFFHVHIHAPFLPSDLSLPRPTHPGSRSRRISDLQDIPELDEDVSTSSNTADNGIPPPVNLDLERQFVEGDMCRSALTCQCVYCICTCTCPF